MKLGGGSRYAPKRTLDEIADWAPPHGYPRAVVRPRSNLEFLPRVLYAPGWPPYDHVADDALRVG